MQNVSSVRYLPLLGSRMLSPNLSRRRKEEEGAEETNELELTSPFSFPSRSFFSSPLPLHLPPLPRPHYLEPDIHLGGSFAKSTPTATPLLWLPSPSIRLALETASPIRGSSARSVPSVG